MRGGLLALPIASLLVMAASPAPKTFDLSYRSEGPGLVIPSSPVVSRPPSAGYVAAPTPNRDILAPAAPSASNEAYVSPGLFTRGRQNRGEGFLAGSTAQEDQDRHSLPGAGFNLKMPLQK